MISSSSDPLSEGGIIGWAYQADTLSQIFRRHSGQDRPKKKIVIAVEELSKCETPVITDCEIQRRKRWA
jgi:hypothetical protein